MVKGGPAQQQPYLYLLCFVRLVLLRHWWLGGKLIRSVKTNGEIISDPSIFASPNWTVALSAEGSHNQEIAENTLVSSIAVLTTYLLSGS